MNMEDQGASHKLRSVMIDQGTSQGKIEEIQVGEGWLVKLRFSTVEPGQHTAHLLELSEDELIDLLQKALRAGILSTDFVNNLSAEFEI
jgi:hypothetical protein